jgi:hypothetical protein
MPSFTFRLVQSKRYEKNLDWIFAYSKAFPGLAAGCILCRFFHELDLQSHRPGFLRISVLHVLASCTLHVWQKSTHVPQHKLIFLSHQLTSGASYAPLEIVRLDYEMKDRKSIHDSGRRRPEPRNFATQSHWLTQVCNPQFMGIFSLSACADTWRWAKAASF